MKKEMWLIWKNPETRRRYKIGILIYEEGIYTFKYEDPELNDAMKVGFDFYAGFFDIHKEYKSERLFANIETRLPNPKRPDYLSILNSYDLDKNSTNLEILEATKGRLVTDNYEFVPAFDKSKIEFDVAGTRYLLDNLDCKEKILVNDKLLLELECDNEYDENAVKVLFVKNGVKYHLGYVPRYYAKDLALMLNDGIEYSAMVQSINFESIIKDEDISVVVKLIFK